MSSRILEWIFPDANRNAREIARLFREREKAEEDRIAKLLSSISPDEPLLMQMMRIYERRAGLGANIKYASEYMVGLRIQAMREALGFLGSLDSIAGCDTESVGHMRACIAAVLAEGGAHGHH